MNNLDKLKEFEEINELLELYEPFLTSSQIDIMHQYYHFNLSLAEIKENKNISRAAIDDCIKKSIQKLIDCENKLHLKTKKHQLEELILKVKENPNMENIEQLERMIKNGI